MNYNTAEFKNYLVSNLTQVTPEEARKWLELSDSHQQNPFDIYQDMVARANAARRGKPKINLIVTSDHNVFVQVEGESFCFASITREPFGNGKVRYRLNTESGARPWSQDPIKLATKLNKLAGNGTLRELYYIAREASEVVGTACYEVERRAGKLGSALFGTPSWAYARTELANAELLPHLHNLLAASPDVLPESVAQKAAEYCKANTHITELHTARETGGYLVRVRGDNKVEVATVPLSEARFRKDFERACSLSTVATHQLDEELMGRLAVLNMATINEFIEGVGVRLADGMYYAFK